MLSNISYSSDKRHNEKVHKQEKSLFITIKLQSDYNRITIGLQSDYNRITIGTQSVASSSTSGKHAVQAVP